MMLSIVHLRARCSALYKPVERLIYQALTIKERQRDMNAKRFISYAALLAGVLILNGRLNAAVESEIVGYTTVTTNQKWNLMAVSYVALDATGVDAVDSNELFSDVTGLVDGDMIQIPNGSGGYNLAYWNSTKRQWCESDRETPCTWTAERGRGFWLYASQASDSTPVTVTAVGAVNLNKAADRLTTGFTIFSPAAPLGEVSVNHAAITWRGLSDGDVLQIPNGTGGYNLAYWSVAKGMWCESDNTTPSAWTFRNGQACWVLSASSSPEVTFSFGN